MPEASNDAASSKRCLQWMYVLSLGDGVAQWKLVQSGSEIRRVSHRNSQCNRQTQVVFIDQLPNLPQYAQMGRMIGGGPATHDDEIGACIVGDQEKVVHTMH